MFFWNSCFFDDPAAATAKSHQSCPTLCNPIDGSPPGSSVPGNLQARTLEWVAISFSNVWKWKVKAKSLSRVRLLATPWTSACQAPPSMGFSRQEYWSGVPLPSPDDPTEVANLISGSSAFSKSSLNIWKFTVHILLKPGLENFEHYFASMWDECNCVVVWYCLSLGLEWKLTFSSPVATAVFQICWHVEGCTLIASSFRIWNSSTGIPSPLPFCISFSWGSSWLLPPVQCHNPPSIVLQALCLSDLIPWIYFSQIYNL